MRKTPVIKNEMYPDFDTGNYHLKLVPDDWGEQHDKNDTEYRNCHEKLLTLQSIMWSKHE